MKKLGPSRPELLFRLWFSVAGLILLGIALVVRGAPDGLAMFEVVLIAGAFFGGTLIWTLYQLFKPDKHDGL